MKKLLCLLLAGTLVFSTAACGSSTQDSEAEADNTKMAAEETTVSEDTSEQSVPEEAETEDGQNILIAYFSWSGNTEELAGMIQSETGGELFEIEPAEPYTEDYDALLDQAQQEQRENARPELAAQVENWDSYDVIFVGFPNWLAYHKLIQCTQIA